MSQRVSPSTNQVYGLQRVTTRIWACHGQPSTVIASSLRPASAGDPGRSVRWRTKMVWAIRQLLQDSPFYGEGYRTLKAGLLLAGIRTRCGLYG